MLRCALVCFPAQYSCSATKQRFTAPACDFLGGWKQSYFCDSPLFFDHVLCSGRAGSEGKGWATNRGGQGTHSNGQEEEEGRNGQMLRLINGPSLVAGMVRVRVWLRCKAEGRGGADGNRVGEESQPRPISQTVNDRHMD